MLPCLFVDKYDVNIQDSVKKQDRNNYLTKQQRYTCQQLNTFADMENLQSDSVGYLEMNEHKVNETMLSKQVPVYILSPIVTIIWLYLCPPWKKQLDFNFKRPQGWNDDCEIVRFNDTYYLTKHHVFDWHSFAMLSNGEFLHEALIVQNSSTGYWVICSIDYKLPKHIRQATTMRDFANHKNPDLYMNLYNP